jgi:hypothetical protein
MRNEYRPYLKEGLHCLLLDIVIILIGSLAFIVASQGSLNPLIYLFFPAYIIIECFVNYNIPIRIFIERKHCQERTSLGGIHGLDIEDSSSGWLFQSALNKIYPQELDVDRYKLILITNEGKRIKVRSVMARNRCNEISSMIFHGRMENVRIKYGALSKILFEIIILDKKNKEINRINFFDNRL